MLIDRRHQQRIVILSALSALLALVAAATSLLNPSLYEHVLAPELLLGSLGGDMMSVIAALGVLACLVALERGAVRAWMPWVGLQAYLAYAYALYAFGLVFTPLFLAYVAIVGLSTYALFFFGRSVHPAQLSRVPPNALPRRTMSAALLVIASGFAAVWFILLATALGRDADLPAAIVIVLDLAIALPFLVVVAVMLWRRRPMGYLLAPGVFGLSAAITLGVAAAELARPMLGGGFTPLHGLPYLVPGLLCAAFAIVAYRRLALTFTDPTH